MGLERFSASNLSVSGREDLPDMPEISPPQLFLKVMNFFHVSIRRIILCVIPGLFFAMIAVLGDAFHQKGTAFHLFSSSSTILATSVRILEMTILFALILLLLFRVLDGTKIARSSSTNRLVSVMGEGANPGLIIRLLVAQLISLALNLSVVPGLRGQLPSELLLAPSRIMVTFFYYCVGTLLLFLLLTACERAFRRSRKQGGKNVAKRDGRNIFVISCLVLLTCFTLFLAFSYPGNVPNDGYNQLNQFFGFSPLSNAHPIVATFFIGAPVAVGRMIGGDNLGVFTYVVLQCVISALIFASVCREIWMLGFYRLACAALAFFALLPIWSAYSITLAKDPLFIVLFLLFVLHIVRIIVKGDHYSFRALLGFTLISLLVSFIRPNGIYIVVPSLVALIIAAARDMRMRFTAVVIITLSVYVAASYVLIPAFGIPTAPPNEMMSIPYQQTARYVVNYPKEVTPKEKAAINTSINYKNIPKRYNPMVSDPIKGSAAHWGAPTKAYLKVWAEMFFKHPLTYFSATFNNTYLFYYPFNSYNPNFYNYISGYPYARGLFDFHYLGNPSPLGAKAKLPRQVNKTRLMDYLYLWKTTPLNIFTRPGAYIWFLAVLVFYLIDARRYRELAVFIPAIFAFASCIVSPNNGNLRYALPYMVVAPLLLATVLMSREKRSDGDGRVLFNEVVSRLL